MIKENQNIFQVSSSGLGQVMGRLISITKYESRHEARTGRITFGSMNLNKILTRSASNEKRGYLRVLSRALPGHHLHHQDQAEDSLLFL